MGGHRTTCAGNIGSLPRPQPRPKPLGREKGAARRPLLAIPTYPSTNNPGNATAWVGGHRATCAGNIGSLPRPQPRPKPLGREKGGGATSASSDSDLPLNEQSRECHSLGGWASSHLRWQHRLPPQTPATPQASGEGRKGAARRPLLAIPTYPSTNNPGNATAWVGGHRTTCAGNIGSLPRPQPRPKPLGRGERGRRDVRF